MFGKSKARKEADRQKAIEEDEQRWGSKVYGENAHKTLDQLVAERRAAQGGSSAPSSPTVAQSSSGGSGQQTWGEWGNSWAASARQAFDERQQHLDSLSESADRLARNTEKFLKEAKDTASKEAGKKAVGAGFSSTMKGIGKSIGL